MIWFQLLQIDIRNNKERKRERKREREKKREKRERKETKTNNNNKSEWINEFTYQAMIFDLIPMEEKNRKNKREI